MKKITINYKNFILRIYCGPQKLQLNEVIFIFLRLKLKINIFSIGCMTHVPTYLGYERMLKDVENDLDVFWHFDKLMFDHWGPDQDNKRSFVYDLVLPKICALQLTQQSRFNSPKFLKMKKIMPHISLLQWCVEV